MGDISFPNIPQNIRVPLFYADIDPSNANTGQQSLRALIVGQMLTGRSPPGSAHPDCQ
jgi:phage tail sheath gpL-like